jgi:hypothetical protein
VTGSRSRTGEDAGYARKENVQPTVEPRLVTIEGTQTLVIERTPPLQPRLDALLSAMYHVRFSADVRPSGARIECEVDRDHPFAVLRIGRHTGLDGIIRDLKVSMCPYCGAVQVRDVSLDTTIAGEPVPRNGDPLRRDHVIGWYTGKRRAGREYR